MHTPTIQIVERLHLVRYDDRSHFEQDSNFECLCALECLKQHNVLDPEDHFSPPDIGRIFDFCQVLERRLLSTDRHLALLISTDAKHVMNTLFLIGGYMVMKMDIDLETTMQCFYPIMSCTDQCRNAFSQDAAIHLRLQDCLGSLHRAKKIGWVDFAPNRFDVEEYRQLDSPLNADLHEIVPGKIVMMRGPRDLPGGASWLDVPTEDGRFGHRDFSPAHYAEILQQLDVRALVRCNAPAYDRDGFEAAGIAVVDLCCEDGAPPPIDVVSKFLALAEQLPGALAVHCGSGRGRSGTLVALYLMKHHGFTAREAVGWLRIVRPGW